MSATPEELLAAGDPQGALKALQQKVRSNAADVRLRTFLFQLLAVLGQWQRATDQLKVCGELDAGTLAMVNTYRTALQCEAVREAVFAGRTLPHVFGPPTEWVALLAQALKLDAEGQGAAAAAQRAEALEHAEACTGTIEDAEGSQAFEWIADADSRLGPVLEVIVNGRYGWLPMTHLSEVSIEPVVDLRDLVWAPAHLTFSNGGDTVALLPARYAGTPLAEGGTLAMSRQTEWIELAPGSGQYRGVGQRVLATDAAERGLLEVRRLVVTPPPAVAS
ncbi:MAG: virulence protein SciE type [Burkholderiales bacterium]|nr:virulence protein SciE type [Burkholderiales bacterium]